MTPSKSKPCKYEFRFTSKQFKDFKAGDNSLVSEPKYIRTAWEGETCGTLWSAIYCPDTLKEEIQIFVTQ